MIGCICKLYNELLLIRLIVYFLCVLIFLIRFPGKTRTTFFKNMYVFSQKDYPVFLMLIFNALCISFSCELIVRNFTWDPCIPYIPAWLKWIVK